MGILIMSQKEREQLKVFEKLAAAEITQIAAAKMLKLSTRWVRKKLKRYKSRGDAGLVHLGRGKPSPNRWNTEEQCLIVDLLKSEWKGFGPTFVSEKLNELKNIKVSSETVRQMMIAKGFWIVGKRKQKHRKWRERKLMIGVMVQLDGSPHDWFEGRGAKCTLVVFIDDATSQILWLEFVENESFKGVSRATKKYMEKHGRPISFYVDYGAVFSVNLNNADREKITQFECAIKDLNVDIIHARSPQAKGRVERCNKTMQDRLVKEMRLAGISSIEEANKFVQESNFIEKHNAKFAIPPAQKGNAHRSIEGYDLYRIFCAREERVITNDFTISYKGTIIQLIKQQPTIIRPKNRVMVCEHLDGKITICIRNTQLNFEEIGMRKRKQNPVDYVCMENENQMESRVKSPCRRQRQNPVFCCTENDRKSEKFDVKNRNFSLC